MNEDVAALNEQIARIKGWQPCVSSLSCEDSSHWRQVSTGFDEHNGFPPDYTQPAMWAGLLMELMEDDWYFVFGQPMQWIGRNPEPGALDVFAANLGLAVCRAYVAAHLPTEAQAKGEGR